MLLGTLRVVPTVTEGSRFTPRLHHGTGSPPGTGNQPHQYGQTDQTNGRNQDEPLAGARPAIMSVLANMHPPHRKLGDRHLLQLGGLKRLHGSIRELDRNRSPDPDYLKRLWA